MSFSAAWLTLREPYDNAARNRQVLDAVAAAMAAQNQITIVDLACGTGSTLRAVAPHLKAMQNWRLVDNDLSLLGRAGATTHPRAKVTTVPIDLAHDLEAALDGPVDLVTTSALLDLVSDEWLERLAIEIAARRLPIYAALTYDGRIALEPVDQFDATIISAVNRHQRTDKGLGAALGPDAAHTTIARFERVRYAVTHGRSDWVFDPQDHEIQTETLTGWATAAREIGVTLSDTVGWLKRRRALIDGGRSSIRVGHVDIFARPTGTR